MRVNQAAIVDAAASGDHRAFGLLAEQSADRLYGTATLILRDRAMAEDAVQDALVRAWRDLPTLKDRSRWDAWVRRLTVHACIDEARRRRRRPTVTLLPEHDRPVRDATTQVADRDQLERAFARLSAQHRAALVLHHHVGLPLPEIADALGVPLGTAKSRLHHARRAMRAALETDERLARTTGGAA
jgi:RNA polymerase sigma-70 factor (ECF subfamily)